MSRPPIKFLLVTMLLLAAWVPPALAEKRVALVIGNAAYQQVLQICDVRKAVNIRKFKKHAKTLEVCHEG